MTDVLIQLIEDVGILGQETTELIMEQFERYNKVRQKDVMADGKLFFFF